MPIKANARVCVDDRDMTGASCNQADVNTHRGASAFPSRRLRVRLYRSAFSEDETMESFEIVDDESVFRIACKDIVPRSDNRALDPAVIDEIAQSFEKVGQTTPVIVRRLMDGRYELVDGHHRLAAKEAAFKQHPENAEYREICCIVRDLTDAEAEIQMVVANIQKPLSIAEKGRLYERIGIRVDELRASNPAAFAGMDRGSAIASCASKGGTSVSKATVYRSINEAHAEDGTHEYAGMNARQRKAVSRMRTEKRKEAAKVLAEDGTLALDDWIAVQACAEAASEVDASLRKIYSAVAEIRRAEAKGAVLNMQTALLVKTIEEIRNS